MDTEIIMLIPVGRWDPRMRVMNYGEWMTHRMQVIYILNHQINLKSDISSN